jgi:hypothetical protein
MRDCARNGFGKTEVVEAVRKRERLAGAERESSKTQGRNREDDQRHGRLAVIEIAQARKGGIKPQLPLWQP